MSRSPQDTPPDSPLERARQALEEISLVRMPVPTWIDDRVKWALADVAEAERELMKMGWLCDELEAAEARAAAAEQALELIASGEYADTAENVAREALGAQRDDFGSWHPEHPEFPANRRAAEGEAQRQEDTLEP
jgi:hypothetical protein